MYVNLFITNTHILPTVVVCFRINRIRFVLGSRPYCRGDLKRKYAYADSMDLITICINTEV